MRERDTVFNLLNQSSDSRACSAIINLIETGSDAELNRINALAFAQARGLDEQQTISAFLHAARLSLFEMSWNVLCPGCSGVLERGTSLRSIDRSNYHCALCSAGYEATLDDMVEVTFTVNQRTRHIAAHEPETLPFLDYFKQIFWSSGIDLPSNIDQLVDEIVLDAIELPHGERASFSLNLAAQFIIVFDPVTHAAQFVHVKGEATRERQILPLVLDDVLPQNDTITLRPGPVRITIENRSRRRTLPALWVAGEALHALLGRRRPFLTAKRLLTNQTFRDIFRTQTLDVSQRLKITSLTFLFTDLKGSTELYEDVGDLEAYELVQAHFSVLTDIVAAQAGAVVKTIGDAVMAIFPLPERAVKAALAMRDAMVALNHERGRDDLRLKIGIHEGPCLAVILNEQQDYFGQTVNIASRVQGLARSNCILATRSIAENADVLHLMRTRGTTPAVQATALRYSSKDVPIFQLA